MSRSTTPRASFILFVLLAASACATVDGVAGRWQGSVNIPTKEGTRHDTAFLVLREKRGRLTGSAGPNEDIQAPITQGLNQDGVLTFRVELRPGTVMDFALEDEGDHLTGIATGLPPNTDARVVVNVTRVRGQEAPSPTGVAKELSTKCGLWPCIR